MPSLLELKQTIKVFYVRYETYILHILRFLIALVALLVINSTLHFETQMTSPVVVLVSSLLCAILPAGFTIFICAAFVLIHLFQLSVETFAACAILFLFIWLSYARFLTKDILALVLTPLAFYFHLPQIVPLVLAIFFAPSSMITLICGTVIYFFLHYISVNAAHYLPNSSAEEIVTRLQGMAGALFADKTMLFYLIAFSATFAVTYLLRRRSMDHAWTIAIVSGSFTDLFLLMLGDLFFDTSISIPGTVIGVLLAGGIGYVVRLFAFHLDYQWAEQVQFEDDDYYYYVKAIPKVAMTRKQEVIKQITRQKTKKPDATD